MKSRNVAIIDTGVANVGSVCNCLKRLGVIYSATRSVDEVETATHVIIPGVGMFDAAMGTLNKAGLPDVLRKLSQPVLGICLGMQLLGEGSEEGKLEGLAVIPVSSHRLASTPGIRVPHMGWNTVVISKDNCPLLQGIGDDAWFYFANSYCQPVGQHTVGVTEHGSKFSSIVQSRNFFGVQFHPEKSGALGIQLVSNFLRA